MKMCVRNNFHLNLIKRHQNFTHVRVLVGIISIFCIITSCQKKEDEQKLYTLLPAAHTRIDFINELTPTEEFNAYTYRNFYNGGGVGIGDVNNDGLPDIYFCGNQVPNKLYINKGNFLFEDVTERAGVASEGVWSTGVSMVDVNGDGWLDIYVCKSGDMKGENRHNELFINNPVASNGDVTFTEQAEAYNIADKGLSTHAAFFDYDKDGDLDCYLLNNSFRSVGNFDLIKDQREIRDSLGGNKLYRNDGNVFTDVSEEAGIYGSQIGFGLGVTVGDVNRDGWPDIYVSNDFFEKDYLYINQQNGKFEESLEKYVREISLNSMGADMADINNDGFPEIFVTDMLPEGDARIKTTATFENWDKYQRNIDQGYYRQFTRNVLQLNLGKITDTTTHQDDVYFSEIGRMAGVYATDWSWGALIMDMDNDGYKDILVANGIYKDLMDQDYINFMANPEAVRKIIKEENEAILKLIDMMPSQRIPNYAFKNEHDLTFTNKAEDWGLATPSHSNGSAYGDLDNDGDLDLVTNNVNMPPFIYKNNAEKLTDHHFLTLKLKGKDKNTFAIGAQVTVRHEGELFYQEHIPSKGFQSSVGYGVHFGLGDIKKVDAVEIHWPDGEMSVLTNVKADTILEVDQQHILTGNQKSLPAPPAKKVFTKKADHLNINYTHYENDFNDFDRDRLIYHMLSNEGPKSCKADVNADGLEDIFIGGAKGFPGKLFYQTTKGNFVASDQEVFEKDRVAEDTDCIFFDCDGDGDMDLYVASGGNEFPASSTALIDRLYLNDGSGNFSRSNQILPTSKFESSSCVKAADFDQDGDLDLCVGIRLKPFKYGVPVNGYILENNGHGEFKNVTEKMAPGLLNLGLIRDVQWADIDQDNDDDLVIVGEWMGIKIFKNEKNAEGRFFRDVSEESIPTASGGFWNCLEPADLDNDGDVDFVIGNHGLNTKLKASAKKPISMYINDFDKNGQVEQIICIYNGDAAYPLVLRKDLIAQIPELKKKYLRFANYKEQTIHDMFSEQQVKEAIHHEVYETKTSVLLNDGNGKFSLSALPKEAQYAPVFGMLIDDFDKDGNKDILLGGNFYRSKPEVGIYDGSYGTFLKGDGKGGFSYVPPSKSGFFVIGEIRELMTMKTQGEHLVFVLKNNDDLEIFSF